MLEEYSSRRARGQEGAQTVGVTLEQVGQGLMVWEAEMDREREGEREEEGEGMFWFAGVRAGWEVRERKFEREVRRRRGVNWIAGGGEEAGSQIWL